MKTATTLLVLALAGFANAGLFPAISKVKPLEAKNFKKALKDERAAVIAFVAPWCGHCQRLVPEMSKAAASMDPLVPFYAVDCDADANKQLCGSQGVKGFPTVKMFPRGLKLPPQDFQDERTASKIFQWAQRSIPAKITRVKKPWGITKWKNDNTAKPRAILLNKSNKLPLLWKVLANKYTDKIAFANVRDPKGRTSKALGFPPQAEEAKKESRVVVYASDGSDSVLYSGSLKYEALNSFLETLAKGDLDPAAHISGDAKLAKEGERENEEARERGETFDDEEATEEKRHVDSEKKAKKSKKGRSEDEL